MAVDIRIKRWVTALLLLPVLAVAAGFVITHPEEVDGDDIQLYQARQIFSGADQMWIDFSPIRAAMLPSDSPEHLCFVENVLQMDPMELQMEIEERTEELGYSPITVVYSETEMRNFLKAIPGAVGYLGCGFAAGADGDIDFIKVY